MKNKKIPMRRCVGCMESKPKNSLVRIACYDGNLSVDPSGKAKGRGVYLCPRRECMEKARKRRALQRSFDVEIPQERLEELMLDTSQLVKDVGTMLEGREAVKEGLINEIGGIREALARLHQMIEEKEAADKNGM